MEDKDDDNTCAGVPGNQQFNQRETEVVDKENIGEINSSVC